MDLNWLQDFVCLGRTLSFTRAAEERNITQSAFSRRVKSLENWIGVALIDRATFPVQLSPAGRQFLPVAKAIIAELLDARQAIREQDQGDKSFQRFAVLHTISVNYLTARLEELEAKIDTLRARVISDSLSTCCQLLAEGGCDFLLCYRHPDVPLVLDESQFSCCDLGTEWMIPVGQTQAMTTHGWRLPGRASEPVPYLAYERSSFLGAVVDQTISRQNLHLNVRYVDGLVEAIKRRVLNGSGVGWLPFSAIKEELAAGQVQEIGAAALKAQMTLSVFCSPSRLDDNGKEVWEQFVTSEAEKTEQGC
ncbi:LysR family transcriptional regulator [Parasulfitobacter algicola]|uniref:LysR family transcriptional regulator n=1 Tax=Parasulfitobacter algicola TaxID=2614809 RepID=A0ABX2IQM5_9RHOB|nr:LysR family transcriptional regulator [Sulfitobacter algicola]NSX55184.1 LysR family transcriptional regulator [Sulfitobacter algicola]